MRAVERRAAAAASAVLCVSESDCRAFAGLGRSVVLTPNGVDDEFFDAVHRAEPGARPRVLFFGQLSYEPNALGTSRFLREGWPLLRSLRPNARLRLVGAGAPAALRQLADRTAGVERVGFVPDLVAELAVADVAVVPLWAGGGTRLKVLEAMAAAAPVVGTGLGVEGIDFESDVHGLIRETPAELAEAVDRLIGDPDRSRRLAAAGRLLAEDFRWPQTLAPAEALYRELAALSQSS